jgi:hypothetical protein
VILGGGVGGLTVAHELVHKDGSQYENSSIVLFQNIFQCLLAHAQHATGFGFDLRWARGSKSVHLEPADPLYIIE